MSMEECHNPVKDCRPPPGAGTPDPRATADVTFFAEALTRLNGRPTATVKSVERPVPLEYAYSHGAHESRHPHSRIPRGGVEWGSVPP